MIRFEAYGEPVAQGSLRSFVRDGRAIVTYGPRAVALGTWRGIVAAAALDELGDRDAFSGPVVLELRFTFRRPATHHGAHGVLPRYRDALPGPDIDKLARAVLDALTGIAYRDDRQVIDLMATKAYGDRPGVSVAIEVRDPVAFALI